MTLQVIGAGFGRTGTLSLKLALEKLGFSKCYHMEDVGKNPTHGPIWIDAAAGRTVNWDSLFAGYQAAVDLPPAIFCPELIAYYPNAKVILTLRDPESWYANASQTILRLPPRPIMALLRVLSLFNDDLKLLMSIAPVARKVGFEYAFDGNLSKEHVIDVFNRHNQRVQQLVPSEKLLVYEIKEGWEPLSTFLNVAVPDEPFPRVNTRTEFGRRRSLRPV